MDYTLTELLFFLLCYSFMGWCIETVFSAIIYGRFSNKGFLNVPFSLAFGFAMDLILMLTPSLKQNIIVVLIMDMVIVSAVDHLSNFISVRLTGNKLWNFEEFSVYTNLKWRGWWRTLIMTGMALVGVYLIHPVLFLYMHFIPALVLKVIDGIFLGLVLVDGAAVIYTLQKKNWHIRILKMSEEFNEDMQEWNQEFGSRLTRLVWKRIHKAYPDLRALEEKTENEKKVVFAGGVCFHKLVWIFMISALIGDLIETVYCRLVGGTWMSRSSVIYGPFSIVWGMGAVLLTVLLYRLAEKEDRYVFFGGFLLGGTYEYLCSLLSEIFLGTTFWDYSEMPFNIGGRTNLLYCVFWGILSVVWIKICYPRISSGIEKIPALLGIICTWCLIIFMVFNLAISAMAVVRYVDRNHRDRPANGVESFIDQQYPDQTVESVWPNLKIVE